MKTFACCSLAGFPSYVLGSFWVFRFSLIRHTHCCRHWRTVFSFSLSLFLALLLGQSFVGIHLKVVAWRWGLKGCLRSGVGVRQTGAGIEVGAKCLTRRPLKSCSSSGLMQKGEGREREREREVRKPQTRWPIFNGHAPEVQSSSNAQQTLLCVYFVYNF